MGVSGELYIGGVALARGYWERPEMTAERFVPDAFSGEAGARLYRTGDVARYGEGGEIEYLGRGDRQVKVRGFRIELGEVEAALRGHEGVHEAAVEARGVGGEEGSGRRLVAYVVWGEGAREVTVAEWREYLGERLPEYMIPSSFVSLKRLPLTPSGKLDRKALPEPGVAQAESEFVAPRTATEEVLAGIWAEVLRVERVGVEDNFFELGGHSLLATRCIAHVREVFRIEVPVRSLLDSPTVAAQARQIEAAMRSESKADMPPPLARLPRETHTPLSFAQQRLWLLNQLEPESPVYNLTAAVRMRGQLDAAALEATVNEVVRRHEVLRTTFPVVEAQPVQLVREELRLKLTGEDVSGLDTGARESEVRRLAEAEARRPFHLVEGPLLRVKLYKLGTDEHVLVLVMHHIVSDGWSMGVLVGEVSALYAAFSRGLPSPLPELQIQYADYAAWQRGWLRGEALERQLVYWRAQLGSGPAPLELPTDRPRPAVQSFRGATQTFTLPAPLAEKLTSLGRRERATLFMTLLAGFKALLHRYTGQEEIVVGTPIAGRSRKELEELIGFFVNTLILRTDLSGRPTFRELLGRVREVSLEASAHQDVPFERLVEELQPRRDLSRSPLFQVMFAMQNTPYEAAELPGMNLSLFEVESGAAKFDLTMFVAEDEAGLTGALEYNTDLFDGETINRLLGHYQNLLAAASVNPDRKLSELTLLSEEEMTRLLAGPNDTRVELPAGVCAPQLFEARASETPGAFAAIQGRRHSSYDRLNRDANRMARALAAEGVGQEALVALLAERSIEFLTTMLAVWKAGGAYLPLDPHAPAGRVAQMLEQSRAPFVVAGSAYVSALEEALASLPEETRPRVLEIEQLLAQPFDEENLGSLNTPRQLAYVIYTSGSTGVPKGVMVEHGGMLNHLLAKISDLELGAADVVAQTASQAFDISVWQFLAALLVGGCVHIFPDEITYDPTRLLEEVGREGVTVLETVPSLLRAMLDEMERRAPEGARLSRLRWLIPTGEALPPELTRRWLAAHPTVPLVNAYGPTECSDDVTHHVIDRPPAPEEFNTPIGRPVANTRLYVLDAGMQLLPVGVLGELYVGGAGVGRGYLSDAAKTASLFVPDPYSGEAGARLYRTGDVGRWLPDGTLEFLGRVDHQVKVRGFRIELGEIEAALSVHPLVREAVVIVREDARGEKLL
ncbi:MAG: amino acid adenylation domain-containing protein, partial [Pyrinomonadaceae bacterium]